MVIAPNHFYLNWIFHHEPSIWGHVSIVPHIQKHTAVILIFPEKTTILPEKSHILPISHHISIIFPYISRHLWPHGQHLLQLCGRPTPSEPRRTSEQRSAGGLAPRRSTKTLGNTSISGESDGKTMGNPQKIHGFMEKHVENQRFEGEHVGTQFF